MSAGHSPALAPYGIRSTSHPASLGWVPRKWWHPPSRVTLCQPPLGLVLQNRIVQRRKSVALGGKGLASFAQDNRSNLRIFIQ
jgi:hypothetical protein